MLLLALPLAKGFCARLENFFLQAIFSYLHQTLSAFACCVLKFMTNVIFSLCCRCCWWQRRVCAIFHLGRKSCGQCLTFVFGLPACQRRACLFYMCGCQRPLYLRCVWWACRIARVSLCVCVWCVRVNLHCSRAALLSPVAAATDRQRHLVLIYGTFCWRFFSRLLSVFFAYLTSYLFCTLPKGQKGPQGPHVSLCLSLSLSLYPCLCLKWR